MKQDFINISDHYEQARNRLITTIQGFPEAADNVKMLGPNCCSVPLSMIGKHGGNLSPRYWLTRELKTQLITLVKDSRGIDSLITNVETVLSTGKLREGSKVPPNVLTALKKAWEG